MSVATIELVIDGRPVRAEAGATVASVLLDAGQAALRRSVQGEMRGPLCGMGVCYECRVSIDGRPHQRSCMTIAAAGMRVETAGDRS